MTAEEYIKDFTRGCSNELEDGEYEYWLTPWQAEAACNLKKEETINKACEFIKTNAEKHIYFDEGNSEWYDSEEFVEDFKNYMKREMS